MKLISDWIVITALLVAPQMSLACSCIVPSRPALAELARSDRVFLGKATSVQAYKRSDFTIWVIDRVADLGKMLGENWRMDGRQFGQDVRFEVVENFKGAETRDVVITSGQGGGDCGVPFVAAKNYLVFARQLKGTSELVTSICNGTDEASRRQAQLAELRAASNNSFKPKPLRGSA
jgi:hypothetical protein